MSLFEEFRDVYLTNSEKSGYWCFRDLHPDAKDPASPDEVLLREEYLFVLAYYNSRNSVLYVFQVEQAAPPQTA